MSFFNGNDEPWDGGGGAPPGTGPTRKSFSTIFACLGPHRNHRQVRRTVVHNTTSNLYNIGTVFFLGFLVLSDAMACVICATNEAERCDR